MKRKIRIYRPTWAVLFSLVAAVLLLACLNPVQFRIVDELSGEELSGDVPPGDGLRLEDGREEFTVTLGVGGNGSRSVAGPDTGGIQYGAIRNMVQVIAVDAATGEVADFLQVSRLNDNDFSRMLTVSNLWAEKRYHFLVLMGHRERDYVTEDFNKGINASDIDYVYTAGDPTLLAAGFLGDREIQGTDTITITMKPVVVDTVFTYGGVTAQAAVGGTSLPFGVDASLVWTITGLATLLDAQNKAGLQGSWGEVTFADKKTLIRNPSPAEASAVLSGEGHNQIVLDLGASPVGISGSANFNLLYIPFGFDGMNAFTTVDPAAARWIIRNGVNDLAQDGNTTFAGSPIPWSAGKNGNGAVAFTAAQGSVDLAGFVPAPSVGASPQTSFYTSQYIGKVKWIPEHSAFQAGVAYRATVFLEPAAGFVFSSNMTASHGGAASVAVTHEYDLSAYVPAPIRGDNPQRQGSKVWVDYSTDKWTINAYWYSHSVSNYGDDGYWSGTTNVLTGDVYGALIILKADKGYPFDADIDFKYPTYYPDNGMGPVRGYYQFDPAMLNKTAYWRWQNVNHTSPLAKYDEAPYELYYGSSTPTPDTKYPVAIRNTSIINGVFQYKPRTEERFVMVGFNTQDTVPVPVPGSPPSGGHEGGVRLVTLGFNPLGIPSNLDSGGATFSEAVAMIQAAEAEQAGYLSLKLNERTAANKGTDANADDSSGVVSFLTDNSPSTVVIDGGNRVVKAIPFNYPFITVGSGVTLTLRNITLKFDNPYSLGDPIVQVESGGVLILEEGAVIRGNNTTANGGGVKVLGTLLMKGGEISGTNSTGGNGGGVYVDAGGTFTMQGGIIKVNGVTGNGGGVYVAGPGGTFTMIGGTIDGNNTNTNGGGVSVASGGTFTMQGGTIGGNRANGGSGGGVYAASGGFFVKSLGTIYGGASADGGANANYAATYNGHAAYAEGGPKKRDATAGPGVPLNSGTATNWEFPALTDSWATGTIGSDSQVDWYTVTAASAGSYLLQWDDRGGNGPLFNTGADILVEATRGGPNGASVLIGRHDHGYNDDTPPPFELAAGETLLVKVEVKAGLHGVYKIRCVPVPAISNAWTEDNLASGMSTWYRFRPGTDGSYQIQWEDSGQHGSVGSYSADIKVSAFRSATYTFNGVLASYKTELTDIDSGYAPPSPHIDLAEGEIIYVVVGGTNGNYRIRGYQCEEGNIATGTTQWHTFVIGTSGYYFLQWEDKDHQAGTLYNGSIKVSAYRGTAPLFVEETSGYPDPQSLGWLNTGETVSVKVLGETPGGTYIVRCYR